MKPLQLVVAVADNGAIGLHGKLPWHIPEDLKHFKRLTFGHAIIMGRGTWDEVGKPLPGRRNIVVTRGERTFEGAERCASLEEAIDRARETDTFPFVIGGAGLFAAAIPFATRIELTEIHRAPEADTFFPAWDRSAWRETSRTAAETEGVEFVVLER